MPEDTILCWKAPSNKRKHVTVRDVKKWKNEGKKGRNHLAGFLFDRLAQRYIDPVVPLTGNGKNGFSIMAQSCLLIEAYESFRQGWPSTEGKGRSPLAFCYFFDHAKEFQEFNGLSKEFYKHVRCGILHQGETTGGWLIRRTGNLLEKDKNSYAVNATRFHRRLRREIKSYCDELKKKGITHSDWLNYFRKIDAVIKNCERKP